MGKTDKLRKLGQSSLDISPVGLGTWQFSNEKGLAGKFWPAIPYEAAKEIIRVAYEGGINWFDTAEVYGRGESEKTLTRALTELNIHSEEVILADKWWPAFRFAGSITRTIDQRIKALNHYALDLYQVHQPFSFSSTRKQMRKMAELLLEGKIRYAGVSNFSVKRMLEAHRELKSKGSFLVSNQVKYNLLDRRIESNGILEAAKEHNISIIAYSPLAQGILTGKFHDNPDLLNKKLGIRRYLPQFKKSYLETTKPLIDLLKTIAENYQVNPAQVALNWLINFHGDTVVAIPGASKPEQANSNARAMNFKLNDKEMAEIDQASKAIK